MSTKKKQATAARPPSLSEGRSSQRQANYTSVIDNLLKRQLKTNSYKTDRNIHEHILGTKPRGRLALEREKPAWGNYASEQPLTKPPHQEPIEHSSLPLVSLSNFSTQWLTFAIKAYANSQIDIPVKAETLSRVWGQMYRIEQLLEARLRILLRGLDTPPVDEIPEVSQLFNEQLDSCHTTHPSTIDRAKLITTACIAFLRTQGKFEVPTIAAAPLGKLSITWTFAHSSINWLASIPSMPWPGIDVTFLMLANGKATSGKLHLAQEAINQVSEAISYDPNNIRRNKLPRLQSGTKD